MASPSGSNEFELELPWPSGTNEPQNRRKAERANDRTSSTSSESGPRAPSSRSNGSSAMDPATLELARLLSSLDGLVNRLAAAVEQLEVLQPASTAAVREELVALKHRLPLRGRERPVVLDEAQMEALAVAVVDRLRSTYQGR